jgi:hypothetical protein
MEKNNFRRTPAGQEAENPLPLLAKIAVVI